MQALWLRWIFFNRTKFIANYFDATKAFIDDSWRMIHRAAGWSALRVFLLVLVVNRFLTGLEVVTILRQYENLTGMDQWCPIGNSQT
ncbi:hypothetical protein SERLA73DRAFT_175098 [Serpula lacrymans var. lacrymans S7.3]|uniref:Uncharacterized protein n=2 Tax=Serpula lacrymans var. lacrymans TaxID=341189 RepID=F8PKM9_SERL3|nr:uncharacterized protein SERLADRAFT_457075 [Serpula lacrymans var. lacrymans S7.9]EGO03576.1 hypothetical protein SERLA73DRAFT_175098 [Serpula lacrymans var. lacrymans S7.3]EGO29395.1 hypothetical protein SERLADRAFT_457075 [Serpula lacrymans var. lacrymans S7.9]